MQLQLTGEMLTLIGGLLVAYFVYVLIARKNDKPSTDSPAMAHAALREIVERAVEEARKLPALNASEDGEQPREGRAIADHSYEDLLATAILNKVIERLQRERVDGNSNVLHITDSSKTKYASTESERGIEDGVGSYECNSDRGASIRQNGDYQGPMSFMMEEQIEEVTTITSDDEPADNDALEYGCTRRVPFPEFGMDIVDPPRELPSPSSDSSDSDHNENSRIRTKYRITDHTTDLVSPIESWEDNWLFQKKKSARSQPDAVAMLVPSSNTCYKALIGDRDAENTSDLSECSSTKSDEEIEKEVMEAINNVIPRSRKTSECDTENHQQVPNDTTRLGEDEIDQVCQAKTKIEEIVAEKVIEDENDKKRPSESSAPLITGTEGKGSETKEKLPKDVVEHSEKTIVSVMESPMQKDVKVSPEKSSERNGRENVGDEDEEQRESEYTEHYDTAVQRHLDSLTKVDVCNGESEAVAETRELAEEQLEKSENISTKEEKRERSEATIQLTYATKENHINTIAEKDLLSAPPRPGTIAEREHKKWENAPPIENNPYSEENIKKRSLERRYSRKSADVTGVQYEMKLDEVNLDALLTSDPPDIKRFGRDYYINQSKMASGDRSERAKSTMSLSSRPSSSLSQRSSCAGDEQRERQVSHELERFEAASLHSSLPRRCCRDRRASSHFAINPLLHLEVARSLASDEANSPAANSAPENPEGEKSAVDLWRLWVEIEDSMTPRHDDGSREGSPGDRDSGMCSIGSRDSEVGSERNRWQRLYWLENGGQIASVGGRRFWTTGHKYHTFGGIKTRPKRSAENLEDLEDFDDLDDESASPDNRLAQSDHAPELIRFKFQTFGGIRKSRRVRLRPTIPLKDHDSSSRARTERSTDEERPSSFEGFASFEHSTSSAFEESDWQDEEDDVANDRVLAGIAREGRSVGNACGMKRRNSARRKNANLFLPTDEAIMDKFLKDVSKRRKASSDDNVTTSQGKKLKSRRRQEIFEYGTDENLKKLMMGSNKRSSGSSKGSRRTLECKGDNKRRHDKSDVRSLSDVTIW